MSRLAQRLDKLESTAPPGGPPRLFFGTTLAAARGAAGRAIAEGFAGPVMLIHWREPDHAERA